MTRDTIASLRTTVTALHRALEDQAADILSLTGTIHTQGGAIRKLQDRAEVAWDSHRFVLNLVNQTRRNAGLPTGSPPKGKPDFGAPRYQKSLDE